MAIEVEAQPTRRHEEDVPEAPAHARYAYVLCGGETAECTCPDACERDHDNE